MKNEVKYYSRIIDKELEEWRASKKHNFVFALFLRESKYGIRTSLENFSQYGKIKVIPLYSIGSNSVILT